MKHRGHHFFICGVLGHYSAGQKVDVRIAKLTASSVAPSIAPVASPLAHQPMHFADHCTPPPHC
ncbi:Plastocyanin-like domain [Musa troglodytarum]|uniref:Plastocyanin-like domain n=1 Tax=Musa troglodytarum TaxID=320322 RepID=A0A9E7H1Z4_9LILI|nr:Plastocyanin-like domain [Musa troglodytarum]